MTILEGNSGKKNAAFTVNLSAPCNQSISVPWATANGTAKAGSDYLAQSGTLIFGAGQTSTTINVSIKGDKTIEPDETFYLNLGNPTNAILARGQGVGTICNDDTKISINNVRVNEPSKGTTLAKFTLTLSGRTSFPVKVTCATADGTARADSDYNCMLPMAVTFKPGETRKTLSIRVNGDRTPEPNETFYVNLSNPANAVTAVSRGVCTIVNARVPARSGIATRQVSRNIPSVGYVPAILSSSATQPIQSRVIGALPEAISALDSSWLSQSSVVPYRMRSTASRNRT